MKVETDIPTSLLIALGLTLVALALLWGSDWLAKAIAILTSASSLANEAGKAKRKRPGQSGGQSPVDKPEPEPVTAPDEADDATNEAKDNEEHPNLDELADDGDELSKEADNAD